LYREPWGEAELQSPQVSDVDDVTTNVSQAWYDKEKEALIVTVGPGPVAARHTSFAVRHLDGTKRYRVLKDDRLLGRLDRTETNADGDVQWGDDGVAQIRTDLASAHTFIIVAEK
jgi:hypothetical protein